MHLSMFLTSLLIQFTYQTNTSNNIGNFTSLFNERINSYRDIADPDDTKIEKYLEKKDKQLDKIFKSPKNHHFLNYLGQPLQQIIRKIDNAINDCQAFLNSQSDFVADFNSGRYTQVLDRTSDKGKFIEKAYDADEKLIRNMVESQNGWYGSLYHARAHQLLQVIPDNPNFINALDQFKNYIKALEIKLCDWDSLLSFLHLIYISNDEKNTADIEYILHHDILPLKLNLTFIIIDCQSLLSRLEKLDYRAYQQDMTLNHYKQYLISELNRIKLMDFIHTHLSISVEKMNATHMIMRRLYSHYHLNDNMRVPLKKNESTPLANLVSNQSAPQIPQQQILQPVITVDQDMLNLCDGISNDLTTNPIATAGFALKYDVHDIPNEMKMLIREMTEALITHVSSSSTTKAVLSISDETIKDVVPEINKLLTASKDGKDYFDSLKLLLIDLRNFMQSYLQNNSQGFQYDPNRFIQMNVPQFKTIVPLLMKMAGDIAGKKDLHDRYEKLMKTFESSSFQQQFIHNFNPQFAKVTAENFYSIISQTALAIKFIADNKNSLSQVESKDEKFFKNDATIKKIIDEQKNITKMQMPSTVNSNALKNNYECVIVPKKVIGSTNQSPTTKDSDNKNKNNQNNKDSDDKDDKPIYKNWLFWIVILGLVVVVGVIAYFFLAKK